MTETNLLPMKRGPGRPPKRIDPLEMQVQESLNGKAIETPYPGELGGDLPPVRGQIVPGIPVSRVKFSGQGVQLSFNGRVTQTFTVEAPENKSRGITLYADMDRRVLIFTQKDQPTKLVPFERVEFMEMAE